MRTRLTRHVLMGLPLLFLLTMLAVPLASIVELRVIINASWASPTTRSTRAGATTTGWSPSTPSARSIRWSGRRRPPP